MARHLLIGTGATSAMSSGVEVDGALNVQKLSPTGPTDLVLGDTIATVPQIRFLQGTTTQNIVTPWIYGRDIINWSGKSYAAATAKDETYTISALTATAAGEATIKVTNLDGGVEPFKIKSWTTSYAIGATATTIANALKTLIAADQHDYFNCDNTGDSDATFDFSGFITGATMNDGEVNTGPPTLFDVSFEDVNATDAARTLSAAVVGSHAEGYGMGYRVKEMEESLMGTNYGYYNRVQFPKAPTTTAVVGTSYDMYSIVATKDGSSRSQIHGVDNLIDISIATLQGDADSGLFENKINQYLTGAFTPVVL